MSARRATTAVWARSRPPVLRGRRPGHVVTLAEAADIGAHRHVLSQVSAGRRSRRQTGVVLLRFVADAAVVALVEPYVVDGVDVVAPPDQVGVVVEQGRSTGIWIGDVTIGPARSSPAEVGARYAKLVRPVAAVTCTTARLGPRSAAITVTDELELSGARLRRHLDPGRPLGHDWVREMQRGTGISLPAPLRSLDVVVDDVTSIELVIPRGCCGGGRRAPADACPMCPLRADDAERRAAAQEWIASLPIEELRDLTGRGRG